MAKSKSEESIIFYYSHWTLLKYIMAPYRNSILISLSTACEAIWTVCGASRLSAEAAQCALEGVHFSSSGSNRESSVKMQLPGSFYVRTFISATLLG